MRNETREIFNSNFNFEEQERIMRFCKILDNDKAYKNISMQMRNMEI